MQRVDTGLRATSPPLVAPAAAGERDYYNIGQAAQALGVSRVSIWRWIRDGRLPALRLGQRTTRIRRQDVDRLLSTDGARGPQVAAVQHRGSAVEIAGDAAPRADWRALGVGEATSAHVVQFYEADAALLDAVKDFIGATLRAGDAGIVIATPAHRAALEERLRAEGLHVDDARAAGRYVALDAADALARLVSDGSVDAGRFREVIGGLIAGASAGRRRVRVFGEMVALPAAAGNHAAAVGLEGLWNELQQSHAFTLFCAYPMDCLSGAEFAGVLGDVCAAHAQVIPAESYTALPSADDRLRAITMLQQQARSLHAALAAERAARAMAEDALRVRDEFLSIAAHELKTPITALSGQTQLLLRRLRRDGQLEPEQLAPALETIKGQADRLTRLIGLLLDISRPEAGTLRLARQATDVTRRDGDR